MSKRTKTPLNSPNWKRFWDESMKVHTENCEYKFEDGKIVGGKAPNDKRIREFYKKHDKFVRLRKKK